MQTKRLLEACVRTTSISPWGLWERMTLSSALISAQAIGLTALLVTISMVNAESPISPLPRASRSTIVHQWSFDQAKEGWLAENQCSLAANGGRLVVTATGEDPFFHLPVDLPGGHLELELRVRSRAKGLGSVFWTAEQTPLRGEDKRVDFELRHDGEWHETTARFNAIGRLTDLRIDPGTHAGTIEFDWIRLKSVEFHPLSLAAIEHMNRSVRFEVKNHQDQSVTFRASGKTHTAAGNTSVWVEQTIDGSRQIEPVSISVLCQDWLPLERTVWAENDKAPAEWIERSLGEFRLQIARDGSVARISRDGQLAVRLGPLVLCEGRLPALRLVDEGPVLRYQGDGVEISLANVNDELTITIQSEKACEGPIVRAKGGLEQGLFAGLEYLGRGECSSSTLDIETDEHIRFAPDPLKVTMPLMAFVTDRVCAAMTWDEMKLQPVYATPNFFDGTSDHRMTLKGNNIKATIRCTRTSLEEAILWAVKRKGLPALPTAPRNVTEQRALCLAALSGPLRTDDGWGHCVQERWPRRPFADAASTVWRLEGKVPVFPSFVPGGAHVPNGTIFFVTGRAQHWLDLQRRHVQGLITRQKPDGSYRYSGKYQRGHFEDTASGVCAVPAARLLEFAYVTGDQQALAAGLRTLDFMKRFRTPRGAQVWECALHTPDQLASAYLVWAYARGYELTGNKDYLNEARKWALSGIPFTYLWHAHPVMCYATPPVYGATNWDRPNWMGLPVQWVGGVYAYALTRLAPHDQTLDWSHLARGILISAQQQQYPDGPHIGLLPDSFNIQNQRRQPADINPCALVSLQLALDGQVDFLSVATDGDLRVAAPFPVTLRDSQATIRGIEGVSYQILVNGNRVVNVVSTGNDVVPLE